MKLFFSIVSIFLLMSNLSAQENEPSKTKATNSLFVELLGSNTIYSFNYERHSFLRKDKNSSFFRVGVLFFPKEVFGANVGGGYVVKKNSHGLELGINFSLYKDINNSSLTESSFTSYFSTHTVTPIIGYKYQKIEGGFLFKVSFTPFLLANGNSPFFPWAGLSFGYSF